MNVICLGGASQRNKEWIAQVAQLFDVSTVLQYDHWNGGEMQFDEEVKKLMELPQSATLFAKSYGTLIALKAISLGFRPVSCVFCGIPVLFAQKKSIPVVDLLAECQIPTLVIQNSEDPAFPAKQLKKFLHEKQELLVWQDNSHDYSIDKLKNEEKFYSYLHQKKHD